MVTKLSMTTRIRGSFCQKVFCFFFTSGREKNSEIVNTDKHHKIGKKFVYNTPKRYNETSPTQDRPRTGRPTYARTRILPGTESAEIRDTP